MVEYAKEHLEDPIVTVKEFRFYLNSLSKEYDDVKLVYMDQGYTRI